MKAVSIAILLFCFQLSLGLIDFMELFPISSDSDNSWIDSLKKEEITVQDYEQSNLEEAIDFGIDFIRGFVYFLLVIGRSVFYVPYTLNLLGVPSAFSVFLSGAYYIIYLLGIAQFVSNRSLEGMR